MKSFSFVLILAVAMMIAAQVKPATAATACPVSIYSGTADESTISVTFKNQGKVPIRLLDLNCAPLHAQKTRQFNCHSEAGVFFPGTPYTLRFSYPGAMPHAIEVSVKSAQSADALLWIATRDQPCRPLVIAKPTSKK